VRPTFSTRRAARPALCEASANTRGGGCVSSLLSTRTPTCAVRSEHTDWLDTKTYRHQRCQQRVARRPWRTGRHVLERRVPCRRETQRRFPAATDAPHVPAASARLGSAPERSISRTMSSLRAAIPT
jgi:hypothetical protein